MKQKYIVFNSSNLFYKDTVNEEIHLTQDHTKAKMFDTIGDAMIATSQVNDLFKIDLFRISSYFIEDTTVSE